MGKRFMSVAERRSPGSLWMYLPDDGGKRRPCWAQTQTGGVAAYGKWEPVGGAMLIRDEIGTLANGKKNTNRGPVHGAEKLLCSGDRWVTSRVPSGMFMRMNGGPSTRGESKKGG